MFWPYIAIISSRKRCLTAGLQAFVGTTQSHQPREGNTIVQTKHTTQCEMLNYRFSVQHSTCRTVARKSSIGGAWHWKIDKKLHLCKSVSCFSLGGLGILFGCAKPTKATPWRWDCRHDLCFCEQQMCILRHGGVLLAVACFNALQVMFAIASNEQITLSDDENASVVLALFSMHFEV